MAGNLRKAALLGNSGSMPPPPVPLKSVIDSVAEHTPHKVTEQPSTSGAAAIPTFFTPGARKASGAKLTSWNAYWDEKKVLDLPSRFVNAYHM